MTHREGTRVRADGAWRCILALDLGTTLGWALRAPDGLITSGTASFRPARFDGGGMRYLRFSNWLTELNTLSGPIAAIWFEEVRRHAGTDASHIYGGLMATLTAWAELRGIPYQGVPVGTIKRHAVVRAGVSRDRLDGCSSHSGQRTFITPEARHGLHHKRTYDPLPLRSHASRQLQNNTGETR